MNRGIGALYWSAAENKSVRCGLCPHRCHIAEDSAGICAVRINRGGALTAAGYGLVSSAALDPIEKKPLYMFHPGARIFSIGGFGCNLRCPFCQNSDISLEFGGAGRRLDGIAREGGDEASVFAPEDIAELAVRSVPSGNIGVAYTYNEPLIGYEFVRDCAEIVRAAGLSNVLVTNGYINSEPLEALLPLIDAMNIDLKGFTESFYARVGGGLEAVKETIASSLKRCHVEVTTLIIPGENEDDIAELAKWLASLDPDIPLHLSRFFPRYRYGGRAPTPRETVLRLRDIARGCLRNVFVGNMG